MKLGVCGFEMSGKSTVFDALTGGAGSGRTRAGEKRVRVVPVPDPRLDRLRDDYQPKKFTPATVQLVDFPGFGGDKSIGELRECDALVCVVMAFHSPNVVARSDKVDWKRDLADLEAELLFADLVLVDKHVERHERGSRHLSRSQQAARLGVLRKIRPVLEAGRSIHELDLNPEERTEVRAFQLLSLKPRIILVNTDDDADHAALDLPEPPRFVGEDRPQRVIYAIRGGLEAEVAQIEPEERAEFLADFEIEEVIADRLIRVGYAYLDLISFLTAGPKEVRAWTIRRGTSAVEAAGKIHSDIQRGFIRAEVVSWSDYSSLGSIRAVKDAKKWRLEGKTYTVQDGDVIEFRHGG